MGLGGCFLERRPAVCGEELSCDPSLARQAFRRRGCPAPNAAGARDHLGRHTILGAPVTRASTGRGLQALDRLGVASGQIGLLFINPLEHKVSVVPWPAFGMVLVNRAMIVERGPRVRVVKNIFVGPKVRLQSHHPFEINPPDLVSRDSRDRFNKGPCHRSLDHHYRRR
jgi:hypothetical protein